MTETVVPQLDMQRYLRGVLSPRELAALALACEDHGFFLLANHGREALVARVFAQAANFFAQDKAAKRSVLRDATNPLGYFDRELTKQKRDQKEVFDFKAGGYISSKPAKQTRWPDHDPAFRPVLTDFFREFTTLSLLTMEMVFVALGMLADTVQARLRRGFGAHHSSAARLNFYPAHDPVPADERAQVSDLGDMALHHHTDPGAITLLLQDDHGGLQARSKRSGWVDVEPVPGTIVVNVGDVMQVWSNDRCVAGMHRVLPVHSERGRLSVPFFLQPHYDTSIVPWNVDGEAPRFSEFSWRDYIRGRVTDNFADYGEEDIQIERYRIA
ncbi:MAG: 2OG-Fe(II) oxygenase family protein [Pseudomonadota bacterium]